MGLHLIKMAAGINCLELLTERQTYIRSLHRPELGAFKPRADEIVHITRFFPKRRDEILQGGSDDETEGSLYWVFQKRIQARQKISGFIEVTGAGGETRCGIVLRGPLIGVERFPRKAFQGWRYLEGADAPPDLGNHSVQYDQIPPDMRRDLEALCLI